MTRSRASAKAAGTRFETAVATFLAAALNDDRIERRARSGAADRGDIGGVRLHGQRVVIEAKDIKHEHCTKCERLTGLKLPQWTRKARIEAGNDDALVGVVVHKRTGNADPAQQWVSMTLADFVAILTGQAVEQ